MIRRPAHSSRAALLAATLTLALTACEGKVGLDGQSDEVPDETTVPDEQTPGTITTPQGEVEPTTAHLRRLTAPQYANTVRAALGDVVTAELLPDFGDDIPTIGLNNDPAILRVNDVNVNSLYDATEGIAEAAVAGTPAVTQCVSSADDACFGELVDELGSILWRRPVTQAEKDDILASRGRVAAASATRAEQAQFVVMVLLASPNMLYRREIGAAGEGGLLHLTDYEIASALSYTLWNAPPDDELRQLAADGQLSDPEVLKAQARRMAEDPRIADSFTDFFVDYLKIDAIFAKQKIDSLGLTPEARTSLVEGIRRDLHDIFSVPGASLLDPFYTMNFSVDGETASFFGVPVAQGGEFEIVGMDPAERLGVLSHPAFLSVHSGEGDSGIVKRGVFTLEQLLCVHLGAPPADISESEDVPADFNDDEATSREVLSVRHSSQAGCVNCHQAIDPAGFGFENYDAVGRYRTVEKETVQIDASGELTVGTETLSFENSVSYIDTLAGSEALRSCLSSQYFTYALGDEARHTERELFYAAFDQNDGAIDALVESLVATPSFTARNSPEEQQ